MRIEAFEDSGAGACWLKDDRIARIVEQALLHFDGARYRLLAWCVMPNHVHVVIETHQGFPLGEVVHSWKSFTANQANKVLGRTGPFWMADYYDRFVRDERHFLAVVRYVTENPVKAGLVSDASQWRWSSAYKGEEEEEAARMAALPGTWKGARGLAEDVRYYGRWMRDEAFRRIGHLYPPVRVTEEMAARRPDLKEYVGNDLTVIAWLWARTVTSPNPACGGVHVPLVSSFWLSKKPGKEAWVETVVDRATNQWRFEVRVGKPADPKSVDAGTKTGRGDFRCILTGDPIPADYIRKEGQAGRIRDRLLAIVAEGQRGRAYIAPLPEHEQAARVAVPAGAPDTDLPAQALGFRVQNYGMLKHRDLFTPRQLTALVTFSDLVAEAREKAVADAREAGMPEGEGLEANGTGARAYGEAVAAYLAMSIDKLADLNNSLCGWEPLAQCPRHLFGRQAIPIVWDFAEANVLSESSGSWGTILDGSYRWAVVHLASMTGRSQVVAMQGDALAVASFTPGELVSTDPPYYDNVPYADLSDFFYIWLRRSLRPFMPGLFSTMLVPKATELIAEPFRHGGKEESERFFSDGMTDVMRNVVATSTDAFPVAIYYAFKQSETGHAGTSSTGWETFLAATFDAGFTVCGTWPTSTENASRLRGQDSNALASSIVLVCRKRPDDAPTITRADFRRLLRTELPAALKALQRGNIAPVDMAQASIGPGMAIFSRHSRVLEADGTPMTVRTALQLINQALDEYLTEQEGEFDGDTRFALTWFETRAYETGPFGEAEVLAKARNVSVAGVAEAGILHSAAGKVRLLRRDELPDDWDPEDDRRLTVWEAAQHLIKRLETRGEQAAAELLAHLRAKATPARDLAYRLYTTCERKGWAEEARSYNGLVVAWPELEKLAGRAIVQTPRQGDLL